MKLLLLLLVACQDPNVGAAANTTSQTALRGDTRVLIFRHAEKANPADWNTDLRDPEGFARARAWVDVLAAEQPTALYASNLRRTQHTLRPTADALGLPLAVRPAVAPSPARPAREDSLALANEILRDHAGETVAVCWHTPDVEDLATALGAEDVPAWDDDSFDHLWTVTVPRHGAATFADATPF